MNKFYDICEVAVEAAFLFGWAAAIISHI